MQGGGALVEQAAAFNAPDGMHVLMRSEDLSFGDPPLPWDLLADGPVTAWSGITIANMTSFADLYLWLGAFADGACKITAEDGNRLPGDPSRPSRYPAAVIHDGSLACLISRKLSDADSEFGACAYELRAAQGLTRFCCATSATGTATIMTSPIPHSLTGLPAPRRRSAPAPPGCSPSATAPLPSPGRLHAPPRKHRPAGLGN